ncbi:hypothetical protein C0992_005153 [Termitomyces sp. T32_za158]|nr:hypothetical protein C0992_005153 [Termitomyces sp. T32_za158]
MPSQKTPQRPQPTISSFFQPSQRSLSGKRTSSPIQLDLTSDSDEEPPAKRPKKSGASDSPREPSTPSRASVASQWRFTPVSPDDPASTLATKHYEAEAASGPVGKRREAFRKKLFLTNNSFNRKPSHPDLSGATSFLEAPETESAGEESDHAFQELNALFSSKSKGKSKASGSKPKKTVAIGPSGESYTPLEQQVLQLKAENTGTVLFFEVGYKLLSRGYRVGIVGQTETAALKKAGDNRNTPFKRKLLHLYTAATYVDDLDSVDDLERYNPPPFMCIVEQVKKGTTGDVSFGMITICPSTGDVVWDDFEDTLMRIELEASSYTTGRAALTQNRALWPNNQDVALLYQASPLFRPNSNSIVTSCRNSSVGDGTRTEYFKETMSYTDAFDLVSEFYTNKKYSTVASENFKTGRLMAEIADFPKRVVIALAHAIRYLSAFSIADAFLETKFFTRFTAKTHMLLAANTLTNLEIYRNETDAVLLPAFNKVAQAFEIFSSPSDVGFKSSLLNEIIFSFPKLKGPMKELTSAIRLDQAAEGQKDKMWVDPERYPEISDADVAIQFVDVELDDQLKASETKVVSRHQPPAVREKMEERLRYQETLQAAANKAFSSFLEEIASNYYDLLRSVINKLATADCLLSLALVALQENYVRPTFTDDDTLEIIDGRHPMVEALRPDPFVPNTVVMGDRKPRSKIITGPNMGGKSSCVRMVALIAIMAQIGSYVPATSVKMGLIDSVLTRMGELVAASDDLARGRSTFMVEMSETSEILGSATKQSLVILDELGRGTSTFDGMAIADAVMQQLVENTKSKTLFITHYPLVASGLESQYPLDVENLHMGFEEDTRINGIRQITFLYRLTAGMASGSFGIECGRLAGLPEPLLSVATDSAAKLQINIRDRARRNRILKSVKLIARCLKGETVGTLKIEELRVMARSIFDSTSL